MTFSEPKYDDGYGSGSGGGGARMHSGFAWPPLTPMVKRLMILNGGIYLACLILHLIAPGGLGGAGGAFDWVVQHAGLAPEKWKAWAPFLPVWQLLTYGFVHELGPYHLLFNMLGLYFFGGMVERTVGSNRFLATYFTAIVLGGLAFLVVRLFGDGTPVVGASGGVLAMIVAAATFTPNAMVIFIVFPIPLKFLAGGLVAMDLINYLLVSRGGAGGGVAYLVHLVGALVGFLAVKRGWIWKDPVETVRRKRAVRQELGRQEDEFKVDRLLEKIHREGMTSLTRAEKEFLKRVSKR
ncbi:MAG: rhomboid family intramembrane serine protease [bacterium]|nr:rhomboid family intramembrane serine protease [bacterium]